MSILRTDLTKDEAVTRIAWALYKHRYAHLPDDAWADLGNDGYPNPSTRDDYRATAEAVIAAITPEHEHGGFCNHGDCI